MFFSRDYKENENRRLTFALLLSLLLHALLLFFIRFEQPAGRAYSSGSLQLNVVLNNAPGEATEKPSAIAAASKEDAGTASVGVQRKNSFAPKPVTATTNTPVKDFNAAIAKKQPDKDLLTVPKSTPDNVVETAPDVLVTQAKPEPKVEKPYAPAPSVEKAQAAPPPVPEKLASVTPVEGKPQEKIVYAAPAAEKPAEKVEAAAPAPAPAKAPEPLPVPAAPVKVEAPAPVKVEEVKPPPVKPPEPVKVPEPPPVKIPEPVKAPESPPAKIAEPVKVAPPPVKVEPPPLKAPEPAPVKVAEAVKAPEPVPVKAAEPVRASPLPAPAAVARRSDADMFDSAPAYKIPGSSELNLSSLGRTAGGNDYKIKFGQRRKTVGIREQDLKYALYVESVRMKLERIGQFNYPTAAAREHLSGALAVVISIRADGSLESFNIIQPAQYEVFNSASEHIVRMSAPFSPLPESIRQETDVLSIKIDWSFSQSEQALN